MLLKMPSDPIVVALLQAIVEWNHGQQKYEFLIYLMPKTISIILGKIERST
jgi:hypothetical protein